MNDLNEIIEGIEKFSYEILIWVLFIPKTLVQIIVNPSWVLEYISREMEDKTDDRFDSYMSPVILILICTILPIAYVFSARLPGATISGPAEEHVNTPMRFVADVSFVQKTNTYHYVWTADEQDQQVFNHDQLADYAIFKWSTPGTKIIHVTADNGRGEVFTQQFSVHIFPEGDPLTAHIDDNYYSETRNTKKDFVSSMQEPTGILITALVLCIPMLFALALNLSKGIAFSRSSFMKAFYIQCYFFSPVILAWWSLLLGGVYFLKPKDEALLVLLPLITTFIFIFWLYINEIKLVMKEHNIRWPLAAIFVTVAFGIITALGSIYIYFVTKPEAFRVSLWIVYGIAILGLSAFGVLRSFVNNIGKIFTSKQPRKKGQGK